jgi:hypothetical protein
MVAHEASRALTTHVPMSQKLAARLTHGSVLLWALLKVLTHSATSVKSVKPVNLTY